MFNPNYFIKTLDKPKIQDYKGAFINILNEIINVFIEDKPMFSMDNFYYQYFDEYELNTACNKEIFSTLYLEIDQPNNYKVTTLNKTKKKNTSNDSKVRVPELYLTLEEIKESIYLGLIQMLDKDNVVWKDKHGICVKSVIYDDADGIIYYYFRILPCLTYHNSNNVSGIMYYKGNEIDIEYPNLAIENFNNKNFLTNDVYRQVILIFKNILLQNKDIEKIPSEIIETIVYNVPSSMLIDISKDSILRILNYLRNMSIKEYTTIDEQDKAFVSIYRSMSLYYVRHVLKIIEKYILTA